MRFQNVILVFAGILLGCVVAELSLRLMGYRPFHYHSVQIDSKPTSFMMYDSLVGYTARPGKYAVGRDNGLHFYTTHWNDHGRATRPLEYDTLSANGSSIHLYGCSFTYGENLDDTMTMGWKLQEQLDMYDTRNYGFEGYGINQAYLLLKKHLESGMVPAWVIVNYGSFYDDRNVLTRLRRKRFATYRVGSGNFLDSVRWPAFGLTEDSTLTVNYQSLSYRPWPMMQHSALIHTVEMQYNTLIRNRKREEEVSFRILQGFGQQSKQYGFRLLVTGILQDERTKKMLQRLKDHGIEVLDISVDLNIPEHNLRPLDGHPSSLANTKYARSLYHYIQANK